MCSSFPPLFSQRFSHRDTILAFMILALTLMSRPAYSVDGEIVVTGSSTSGPSFGGFGLYADPGAAQASYEAASQGWYRAMHVASQCASDIGTIMGRFSNCEQFAKEAREAKKSECDSENNSTWSFSTGGVFKWIGIEFSYSSDNMSYTKCVSKAEEAFGTARGECEVRAMEDAQLIQGHCAGVVDVVGTVGRMIR